MKDVLFWILVGFSTISLPADIFTIIYLIKKNRKNETPVKEDFSSGYRQAVDYVMNNSKKVKQLENLNRNIKPLKINEINNFDYEFTNDYKYKHFDYEKAFCEIAVENYDWFYDIQQKVMENMKNETIYLENLESLKREPTGFTDPMFTEIEDEILKEVNTEFITRSYVYINKKLVNDKKEIIKQEHKVFDLDNALNYCLVRKINKN